MHIDFTFAQVSAAYPQETAQILADMARKFEKAKLTAPSGEDISWSLIWNSTYPEKRPLQEEKAWLIGKLGRRQSTYTFRPQPDAKEPREYLPHHVIGYHDSAVDPKTFPHVATFTISSPNGSMETALATGGYKSKNEAAIHYVIVGSPFVPGHPTEDLVEISNGRAVWTAGLRDLAFERYNQTPEGGDFQFGSKTLTRLTSQEVKNLVDGKSLRWSLF